MTVLNIVRWLRVRLWLVSFPVKLFSANLDRQGERHLKIAMIIVICKSQFFAIIIPDLKDYRFLMSKSDQHRISIQRLPFITFWHCGAPSPTVHCSASTLALSREGSLTHLLIVIKVIMMDNLMMISMLMIIIVNIRPLSEGKFHTPVGHLSQ